MVPGPRVRESRSPLDSRGPLPRRQGASSFLRATARAGVLPGLRRGARSRRHGMSVHAACGSRPLRKILEGPFLFFAPAAHVASQVPEPAEGPASPCAVPSRALPGFSRGVLRTGVARPAPASVLLPFPPAFCIFHTND